MRASWTVCLCRNVWCSVAAKRVYTCSWRCERRDDERNRGGENERNCVNERGRRELFH